MASNVSRVHATFLEVAAASVHTEVISRLYPGDRWGKAVASTGTRVAAPWKRSMRMLVIADGQRPNASTIPSMESSDRRSRKADFQ
jgi:hypothetical protein